MKRGETLEQTREVVKQDLTTHSTYKGHISRSYEELPKYSIHQKGERKFLKYSKKTIEQLHQKYPNSSIYLIKP